MSVTHLCEGPGRAPFNGPVCTLPDFNSIGQAIFDCFGPDCFWVIVVEFLTQLLLIMAYFFQLNVQVDKVSCI